MWLESTGTTYLKNYKVYPGLLSSKIELYIEGEPYDFACAISFDTKKIRLSKKQFIKTNQPGKYIIDLNYKNLNIKPEFWSPENPHLYPMQIAIYSDTSHKAADKVESYIGFRTIERRGSKIYLNDNPLYQRLILNQCYYPKGWYTPVKVDQFYEDCKLILNSGFNGMRIHEKIEDPRLLFCCDAMGLLVWEEMPSPYIYNDNLQKELKRTIRKTISRDFNHPSIITWVVFNESWGLYNKLLSKKFELILKEFYSFLKQEDSTRLAIENSGFYHIATDIIDIHHYIPDLNKIKEYYINLANREFKAFSIKQFLQLFIKIESSQPEMKSKNFIDTNQPIIISEYGGYGFYQTENTRFLDLYRLWILMIRDFDEFSGFCYTQFTDVEQEQNGLFTFNREPKESIEKICEITIL